MRAIVSFIKILCAVCVCIFVLVMGLAFYATQESPPAKKSPAELKRQREDVERRAAEKAREREAELAEDARDPYWIRELFDAHPGISRDLKNTIRARKIQMGMTEDMVEVAWGKPLRRNETVTSRRTHSQWVYGSSYVYFENGIVTSWQTER